MSDLKWLSVWCRAFQVNFGDLVADFTLDHDHEGSDAEAESESEPETVSSELSLLFNPQMHSDQLVIHFIG